MTNGPGRPASSRIQIRKKDEPAGDNGATRVLSIDPGDIHQGICTAHLDPEQPQGRQLRVLWQADWERHKLISELEEYLGSQVARVDAVLLERFKLYPWMAREQGFSEFKTVEVIGIVKYLVGLLDVPLIMMDTSNKNEAVAVARTEQPSLLKKYPSRKKGPVYFVGRNEHERDALAHMAWFAWRDQRSPLYRPAGGRKKAV